MGVGSSRTPKLGGPDELPEQLSPSEVSLGTKVVEPTNLLRREVDRDGLLDVMSCEPFIELSACRPGTGADPAWVYLLGWK